jgi:hypothetical protein
LLGAFVCSFEFVAVTSLIGAALTAAILIVVRIARSFMLGGEKKTITKGKEIVRVESRERMM